MERNTTPTNELITEAADLYVSLLTVLDIPGGVFLASNDGGRRIVPLADSESCAGVKHAAHYHAEAITTPLIAAHTAMHALTVACLDRANVEHDPNGPFGIIARREIKRHRKVIAESEATIRREMERTEARLRDAFAHILRTFRL
ncbi:hypothetical protein AB0C10_15920 [Microbispora amethystogenes]|uniref:hypothetical protein n=1 Tax=Microbispora amethystogenes TaxID=1427754 RepID=UPI0033F8EB20